MQITNVSYRKNFSVSQFIFEHIGLDAQLEPHENPAEVLASLKKQVEELHRQNNPHLYVEHPFISANQSPYDRATPYEQRPDNLEPKTLAQQIRSCKELKVLESYKLVVQKSKEPEDKKAYLEMLEKLSKKEKV